MDRGKGLESETKDRTHNKELSVLLMVLKLINQEANFWAEMTLFDCKYNISRCQHITSSKSIFTLLNVGTNKDVIFLLITCIQFQ